MTRTARTGSKTNALSSTPWVDLKKGYELLESVDPHIDVSDCDNVDEAVSTGSVLGVSKKEKLKTKKKKEKVADKVKKMTRKELEDTVPLLSEIVTDEDHSIVKKHKKKSTSDTGTTGSSDSSMKAKKSTKSKKKTSAKLHEQPEDMIPLLSASTEESSQTVETKKSEMKKKTQIRKTKPKLNFFDEKRQKKIEARRLRRQRRKVCFNCRESGHHVSECTKSRETAGTGICFKCGANNHSSKNCRAKVAEGEFPYAKCFVCGEVGHLSRACPENPKGLYPHGGGCNLCGSVEHFKSNCPTRHQNQPKSRKSTVGRLKSHSSGSVDAEDFDFQQQDTTKTSTRTKKSKPKVVKF